ncbi:hypothetical protein CP532_6183 [Ophiocordyceps camponoti-leonardi (nom. inval.)]|nr:hypothetical protein CP532_6183 [Ophiocordyceps camponoti-leonardi (nom. inval.)]
MAQLLSHDGFFFLLLIITISILLTYRRFSRKTCRLLPLPPGPKPLPIVGNVMDLPPQQVPEFEHWLRHKESYGPISSVSAFGMTIIVLHDKQAAVDLLQKRSRACSGRPGTEFTRLCGYTKWMVLQQDDEYLRRCRKLIHQQLGSRSAVAEFSHIQEEEVARFLFRLLDRPETLVRHLKTKASAIISKVVYGYVIEPHKPDPFVELVELNMANAQKATTPMWLIDAIPAFKHLPRGFPGAGFKDVARGWSEINQMSTEVPYEFVRRRVASGSYRPSFVSRIINQLPVGKDDDADAAKRRSQDVNDVQWSAAMLYNGGLDTSVAILSGFVLAMATFPHVQIKAQEEIERVVGTDRLPGFADRANLPYIDAIVQEACRWNPTAPLGFPHMVSEETSYNGYRIPKGAVIFASIWWICHDPDTYPDPDVFEPARFLDPRNEPNPTGHIFGYGRRVCPGQHLVDCSIFLTIAQVLAAFNIRKATDQLGREIDIKMNTNTGLINRPLDFPYKMAPRSDKYEAMIRRVEVDHPWDETDAGLFTALQEEATSSMPYPTLIILSLLALVYSIYRCYIPRKKLLLPPGPKPWPVIGNIRDLPPKGTPEFQHWLRHKDLYGPISSITIMGQTIVAIHDRRIASQLLEKQSLDSSDRPRTEFAFTLCGFDDFVSSRYDEGFRRRRRLLELQLCTASSRTQFNEAQASEVRRLLIRMMDRPAALTECLRLTAGSILLRLTYGYSIGMTKADPLIDLMERMATNMSLAAVPLGWMVDAIPPLKYLPAGFPGTGFKETAKKWKQVNQAVADIPYLFARRQLEMGSHQPSYVSKSLQDLVGDSGLSSLSDEDEHDIKYTAAIMFLGGTDTTVITLKTFVWAMVTFPAVQRKAQLELDTVVGPDRLPDLGDRGSLPYIEGVVKETLRMSPVTPLGFAHATSKNMSHDGYDIPKGAVVLPSIWWFLHDPEVYAEPACFEPDRYREPRKEPDPRSVVFGFGRRRCPGRYVADTNVFLAVSQMLATLSFNKARGDEDGAEMEAELKVLPGALGHVADFPYEIVPRSKKCVKLVRGGDGINNKGFQDEGDSRFIQDDLTMRGVLP